MSKPQIDNPHAKLAALQRRMEHLNRRITTMDDCPSRDFDIAERDALRDAIDAVRYVVGELPSRRTVS